MAGVGAGIQRAIDGPTAPQLNGEQEWAFVDSSNSLFKLNEVGPASNTPASSGPTTLQIIGILLCTLVLIFVIGPLVKLIINMKRLLGCCWKKEKETYSVEAKSEENGTRFDTGNYTRTERTATIPPRYTIPPSFSPNQEVKWSVSHVDSTPISVPIPKSVSSSGSMESVPTMESLYESLEEKTDPDTGSKANVKFLKSGKLADTIQKCRVQSEKRVEDAEKGSGGDV